MPTARKAPHRGRAPLRLRARHPQLTARRPGRRTLVLAGCRGAPARTARERRAPAASDSRRRGCGGGRGNSGTLVRKTRQIMTATDPARTAHSGTCSRSRACPGSRSKPCSRGHRNSSSPSASAPVLNDSLAGVTVANLFTEPSTRTRVSFELAAKRLGADVVNLEVQLSSRVKGESMLDTIYTLEACHVDVFVIRDAEAGVGGAGRRRMCSRTSACCPRARRTSHIPTQGLLDALTILQAKTEVRWPQGGHRRRRAAFARRALCLARARDARRRRDPHRRAARA